MNLSLQMILNMIQKILFLVLFSIFNHGFVFCITPVLVTGAIGATSKPSQAESHYRFHYMVKDMKTGDFKTKQERGSGDSVFGSYKVDDPNSALQVVNYIGDVASQPGVSPVRSADSSDTAIKPFSNFRSGVAASVKIIDGSNTLIVNRLEPQGPYSGYHTTIPPLHHHKLVRGFNPIGVKGLIPSPTMQSLIKELPQSPYSFYTFSPNDSSIQSRKFADDKIGEAPAALDSAQSTYNNSFNLKSHSLLVRTNENVSTATTTSPVNHINYTPFNNLYQLKDSDISSSVMNILSHSKEQEMSALTETTKTQIETSISTKDHLPQRPMRLIGMGPIFVDGFQLQHLNENFTSIPQPRIEAFSNMQYAAPMPIHSGPLAEGPFTPFWNVPRSVKEPSRDLPLNAIPLINPLHITPHPILLPEPKSDMKTDGKGMQNALPLCNDCLLPANYIPYPVIKSITSTPPSLPGVATLTGSGSQKTQCVNAPIANGLTSGPTAPIWPPYTPSIAYILMPKTLPKSKINNTHTVL